jgi:hypothetical protein
MERREFEFLKAHVRFIEAKTVVEVGVQFGDMAVHLAQAVQENGGKYIGFDLWDAHGLNKQFEQMGSKEQVSNVLNAAGVTNFELFQVDTINDRENFKKILAEKHPDGVDFAFIDGDHSYKGVANDFFAVYPLLSPTGVIAFHDTAVIDGCREFMLELRTMYYDGTFDLIDYPFGSAERHCGVSILSKKSYHLDSVKIDEICGSLRGAGEIEMGEKEFIKDGIWDHQYAVEDYDEEFEILTDKIGHYPGRKKYDK